MRVPVWLWVVSLALWFLITWIAAALADLDPGGSLRQYERRAATYFDRLPLDCRSACTMFLLHGCVIKSHDLWFHLPTPDEESYREQMARHYPPEIAAWFLAFPSGLPMQFMSGEEAIEKGARECGF